ncbi:isoprenylcysteine carboxylmethyltransferase family protein [bacterium]|nr:isoprenylcysteine carboxylmethyltransferase family protein [bacterium]MBU1983450.1 isoprenylcysteine carboxylmethyltransferase family protein [bacterium]
MNARTVRRSFWAVAAFYFLIAFEFFYMATPFAVYFYSAYGPGLRFLSENPILARLSGSFLPHVVAETKWQILNLHNLVGAALFLLGSAAFLVGAGQVYYYKLTRRVAVTGGLYNWIRHPQYAALAVAGFGLLLLWPRYLVLLIYVAILMAYYFLAKIEERECERKFGSMYSEYVQSTGMFLPLRISLTEKLPPLPRGGIRRYLMIAGFYLLSAFVAFLIAAGLQNWTLNSLFALYTENAAYVSVVRLDESSIRQIIRIAEEGRPVTEMHRAWKEINYILPVEWYISEIPMHKVAGRHAHLHPGGHDATRFKIVYTRAILPEGREAEGKDILRLAVGRVPILEVWVDRASGTVTDIKDPPKMIPYEGIPVPLY